MNASQKLKLAGVAVPLLAFASGAGAQTGGTAGNRVTWSGNGGNGHAYEVVTDSSSSWSAASTAAQSQGGHLVTETSAGEVQFVNGLLTSTGAPTGEYWIGLNRTGTGTGTGNDFSWVTGESISFTNWAPGEPNNNANNENRGAIYWTQQGGAPTVSRSGMWNDVADSGYPNANIPTPSSPDLFRAGYVIEFDTAAGTGGGSSVPLPPAVMIFPLGAAVAGYAGRRMRRGA